MDTQPEITGNNTPEPYHKNISIAQIIDCIENKGLNHTETAKLLGCNRSNISQHLIRIGYNPGIIPKFKDNRADVFAYYQDKLLSHLTEEKLKKASAYQIVGMIALLFDKERLARGESTHNLSIRSVVDTHIGHINELEGQLKRLKADQVNTQTI